MSVSFKIRGIPIRFRPQIEQWSGSPITDADLRTIKENIERGLRSHYFDIEAYRVIAAARGLTELPTEWVEIDDSIPDYLPPHGGCVGVHLDNRDQIIGEVILETTDGGKPRCLIFNKELGITVDLPADMRTFTELADFLTRSALHHRLVHLILSGLELASGPIDRILTI